MSRRLSDSLSVITSSFVVFFFNDTAPTEIYTLSLHDALPIYKLAPERWWHWGVNPFSEGRIRSEEHTSELQSRRDLVCRLLLEKKKNDYVVVYKGRNLAYSVLKDRRRSSRGARGPDSDISYQT